ncbi:MAG TPA: hypothetical protein VNA25_04075 [Phycisphaerae bacterium]|nr:hypothetical protein [Phycisphaerae bacterium]
MPDTCPDCGCPLAEPVEGAAYAEMHIADERGGLVCLRRQLAAQQYELIYLREHHDDCHQPAANYELLLSRLDGEPTDHGDCRVAAHIEKLEGQLAARDEEIKQLNNTIDERDREIEWAAMEATESAKEAHDG